MSETEIDAAIKAGAAGRDALARLEIASEFTEQSVADLKTSLGMVGDALLDLSAAMKHIVGVLSRLSVRKTP